MSIGYVASALVGVALGLTGGGGSIVTVPLLIYLFRIEPLIATGYSLFIVGTTSLAGGIRSALEGVVDFRKAIVFSVPATIAIFFTRHYILPHIPESIWTINSFMITRDMIMMVLFAITMVIVALRMIKKDPDEGPSINKESNRHVKTLIVGGAVGILSGIIGAGGGFLIVPALVDFEKLPIKKAVATSLVIIALNSLAGFLGDMNISAPADLNLILTLSALSVAGVLLGGYLSKFIAGENLKRGFGWFTLIMALFVLYKEVATKFIH
jgi:uncharacterized membrane protein YfcA